MNVFYMLKKDIFNNNFYLFFTNVLRAKAQINIDDRKIKLPSFFFKKWRDSNRALVATSSEHNWHSLRVLPENKQTYFDLSANYSN
jgi:hypothetical protein